MLVVVGSSNPVKISAVENVLSSFCKAKVIMRQVPSGVPTQPVGHDEVISGAITRARNALASETGADLGVGIEAGLIRLPGTISGYMDQQFAAIADRRGIVTLGGGPSFEYAVPLFERVLRVNVEVGDIMDEISGINDLGQKQGAIGYFSKGRLDRTPLTELVVLMAFIPRLNEGAYLGEVGGSGSSLK